jgi:serine/threonine protein kinase
MSGMSLEPGTVFAGYVVERLLGVGGMGSVYLARHPNLPRRDALKLLRAELCADPVFAARFHREADTVARLNHPHILPVHDRGSQDGQLWISMPYVEGRDAEAAVSGYAQGMPAELAVHIVGQVGSALDYAHRQQLLHRDVKPANIMLTAAPEVDEPEWVFLTDFGIAKAADEVVALTATGDVIATAKYASPEQIQGKHLDHRSDIYSLGCVLFKLLTGSVPYAGPTTAAMYGHLHLPPPHPSALTPGLPVGFDEVVATAMAKAPDDRYQSCRELTIAAQQALATAPVEERVSGVAVARVLSGGANDEPQGSIDSTSWVDTAPAGDDRLPTETDTIPADLDLRIDHQQPDPPLTVIETAEPHGMPDSGEGSPPPPPEAFSQLQESDGTTGQLPPGRDASPRVRSRSRRRRAALVGGLVVVAVIVAAGVTLTRAGTTGEGTASNGDSGAGCPTGSRQVDISTADQLTAASRGQPPYDSDGPGTCYLLANGSYPGTATLLDITRGGQPGQPIVFAGQSRDGVVVTGHDHTIGGTSNPGYVELRNLTFDIRQEATNDFASTLNVDHAHDVLISNVSFLGDCNHGGHGGHLNVSQGSRVTIEGSLLQGFGHCGSNQGHGIDLLSGTDITIGNNTITGNAARGIQLFTGNQGDTPGQYGPLTGVTIQNNLIEGNGHAGYQDGISLDGASPISQVTITQNVLRDNAYSGVRFNSASVNDIHIANNTFIGNGERNTNGSSPSEINVDAGQGAAATIERNIFIDGPALLNTCARTDGTFILRDNVVSDIPAAPPEDCVSGTVNVNPQIDSAGHPTNPAAAGYGA